jgi:hypothetical protein
MRRIQNMKRLLYCVGAVSAVLVGLSGLASGAAVNCIFGAIANFNANGYQNPIKRCPSSGQINTIASRFAIGGFPINDGGPSFKTVYSVEMIEGPSPGAQPRVAIALQRSDGTTATTKLGTACPEAVDSTVGGGSVSRECLTSSDPSLVPKRFRLIHDRL